MQTTRANSKLAKENMGAIAANKHGEEWIKKSNEYYFSVNSSNTGLRVLQ